MSHLTDLTARWLQAYAANGFKRTDATLAVAEDMGDYMRAWKDYTPDEANVACKLMGQFGKCATPAEIDRLIIDYGLD